MKLADFLKEDVTKKNFDPKKYIGETILRINMIEKPTGVENVQIVLKSGEWFIIQRDSEGLTITGK